MRLARLVASRAIAAFDAVGCSVLANVDVGPAGIEHAFTRAAAKVELRSSFGSQVVAQLLLRAWVAVSDSPAMLGIVLPLGDVGTTH
jgi:hypothetical protein